MVLHDTFFIESVCSVTWQGRAIPNAIEITCGRIPPTIPGFVRDSLQKQDNFRREQRTPPICFQSWATLWRARGLQQPWWQGFEETSLPSSCSKHLVAWKRVKMLEAKVNFQSMELDRAFKKAASQKDILTGEADVCVAGFFLHLQVVGARILKYIKKFSWQVIIWFQRTLSTRVFLFKGLCHVAVIFPFWYSKRLAGITWYLFGGGSKKVSQIGIVILLWYRSQPGYSESTRDTNGHKPGNDTKIHEKRLRKNAPKGRCYHSGIGITNLNFGITDLNCKIFLFFVPIMIPLKLVSSSSASRFRSILDG